MIQSYNYYPFGLTFNSHSRENSTKNNYLYNGKELQDELDLGWMDYGARMYSPSIGRWNSPDPHADFYEITSPYNYCFNNPLIFTDPTGKDNIIYLIATEDFDKEKAEQLAAVATKILADLGLKTQVRFYNSEELGEFDATKLDKTDSWSVIGNNRRSASKLARNIHKKADSWFDAHLQDWSNKEGTPDMKPNPETANKGWSDEKTDRPKGAAINYKESVKADKDFSAALEIIHGAGHNSKKIHYHKTADSDGHLSSGVMMPGFPGLQTISKETILKKENNNIYISGMESRYGTNGAKDNAFEGRVKAAAANTSKKD